jgi:GTP-sensing pleiotropic transcriptional regulator CodY
MGISYPQAHAIYTKLKDVILDRARSQLAMGAMKAVNTALEMLDADASTEKGELRLAAAEKIMDRVGITKHTNVEVRVESENGLFILPAKTPLKHVIDEIDLEDPLDSDSL